MHQGKYILSQVMELIPYHDFNRCAEKYSGNLRVKDFTCWQQFLAMSFGQLSHRTSLRGIVLCLNAQRAKLYHMGFRNKVARSTLADANNNRDWRIYRDFAQVLIEKARKLYLDDNGFCVDLENTVYALDATTIDLCLNLFSWAHFRKKKAGIKLNTLIDLRGNIPTFVHISNARDHEIDSFEEIPLESGAFYLIDRGYSDTRRLHDIHQARAFFVIRWKKNISHKRLYSHPVSQKDKEAGVGCDQTICFTGEASKGGYPSRLRRIKFRDPETGKAYIFLTNHFGVEAGTIAELYKQRWQVELFFKWIKQHLKIQCFWGRSPNAVYTQVWIAIGTYLLVAILKKTLKIDQSMYDILQILSTSLFDKMPLISLLSEQELQKKDLRLQEALF
jgi:Domain of unknown function (DUF4372)/Transposase DDE domain